MQLPELDDELVEVELLVTGVIVSFLQLSRPGKIMALSPATPIPFKNSLRSIAVCYLVSIYTSRDRFVSLTFNDRRSIAEMRRLIWLAIPLLECGGKFFTHRQRLLVDEDLVLLKGSDLAQIDDE